MTENNRWNKKIFAMLLERAKGVRSLRQFSADCGVSYVQMRKLLNMEQENPPRPKLIRKIAGNAFGDVDLEDLLFAAGLNPGAAPSVKRKPVETSHDRLRGLPAKDRRIAEAFIDFLASDARSKQEQHPDEQE